MEKNILPSERAGARREAEIQTAERIQQERDKLRGVLRRIGETPDGKEFFRWLRNECGAAQPILGATNGAIDEKATLYQAMRLNLWIKVRRELSFNILKEVEYETDQLS